MKHLNLQIVSNKPFSDGKFLNFSANTPDGTIEGISWEAANHHFFQPGNRLIVTVANDKKNGAAIVNYKGRDRLEVPKNADIAFSNEGPAAEAPKPERNWGNPAPQQRTATGPLSEDQLIEKCADIAEKTYTTLVHRGVPEELAIRAAANAPSWVPLWWFGEKTIH